MARRAASSIVRRRVVITGSLAADAGARPTPVAQAASASSSESQPARYSVDVLVRARDRAHGPAPTIASHTPRFASQTRMRRVSSSSAAARPSAAVWIGVGWNV